MRSDALAPIIASLLQANADGAQGFETCARHAGSAPLADLLAQRARDCVAAGLQLRALAQRYGVDTGASSTHGQGALHRGWIALAGGLGDADELRLIEECERGEDHMVAQYRVALRSVLPEDTRHVFAGQFERALRSHDRMRTLRDQLRYGPTGADGPMESTDTSAALRADAA